MIGGLGGLGLGGMHPLSPSWPSSRLAGGDLKEDEDPPLHLEMFCLHKLVEAL